MITESHHVRNAALLIVGVIAVAFALHGVHLLGVAHGAPAASLIGAIEPITAPPLHDPVTSPPIVVLGDLAAARAAGGWSLALLAALVMLARAGASLPGSTGAWLRGGHRGVILAGVATVGVAGYDAYASGGVGALTIAVIGAVLALWHPVPPPVPERARQSGRAGLGVMLAVALVGLLITSCATFKKIETAGKTAIVECAKADQASLLDLTVTLAIDSVASILKIGAVDWSVLEARAAAKGLVDGGCAYAKFVALMKGTTPPVQSLISAPDPAVASLDSLRAKFGGARWRLADGSVL